MKQKILEHKKNPLFGRDEIIVEVEANSAPNFAEAQKMIAEQMKSHEDALKIKKIKGTFGVRKFKIYANVYSSKEEKDKTERKTKKEKEAEKKLAETKPDGEGQ